MAHVPALLGGLSADQFLRRYWQKKPLLVRSAWANFSDPLSPEELAGFACEDGVEARLVLERDGIRPWELRHGPFTDHDFLNLPDSHWTLLVQDVEKLVPPLADIIEPFRFIPDWRIDDLMISYAAAQGSVGAHVDNYDVFLLQGGGRRRWQIATRGFNVADLLADTELRILQRFNPEQTWTLEAGDMLYLPPGVAHYGVALEPCMTYSIGFRAPSVQDLLGGFVDFLLEGLGSEARYADPDLQLQDNPGEIHPRALERIKEMLHRHLNPAADDLIERWFGRYITEPKSSFYAEPEDAPLGDTDLLAHIESGGGLVHNPGSRFAYLAREAATALFVDGQEYLLGPESAFFAPLLCRHRLLSAERLRPALNNIHTRELLLGLIKHGYLLFDDDI